MRVKGFRVKINDSSAAAAFLLKKCTRNFGTSLNKIGPHVINHNHPSAFLLKCPFRRKSVFDLLLVQNSKRFGHVTIGGGGTKRPSLQQQQHSQNNSSSSNRRHFYFLLGNVLCFAVLLGGYAFDIDLIDLFVSPFNSVVEYIESDASEGDTTKEQPENLTQSTITENVPSKVKNINVQQPIDGSSPILTGALKNDQFLAEKIASSVVHIEALGPTFGLLSIIFNEGSGFVIRSNGLIITTSTVTDNTGKVRVTLRDGRMFLGDVILRDMFNDIAIIRLQNTFNLPPLKLSKMRAQPGQTGLAVQCDPFTQAIRAQRVNISIPQLPLGIIVAAPSPIAFLKTDAQLTRNGVGSPLVNDDGEVVGLNKRSMQGALAVPSDLLLNAVQALDSNGNGQRLPAFGSMMIILNPAVIAELKSRNVQLPDTVKFGFLVRTVQLGTPAYKSGLQPGDIITHMDNEPLISSQQLLAKLRKGKRLSVKICRNSRIEELTLFLDTN